MAEELIRVVPLRAYGKQLGIEKIMLKQQKMFLYFVSNAESPYYQSEAFGRVLDYVGNNVRRCNLREQNGTRSMVITDVSTVKEALQVVRNIIDTEKNTWFYLELSNINRIFAAISSFTNS